MCFVSDNYYNVHNMVEFTKEEQIQLGRDFISGDLEAGEKLIFSHVNLVRSIARKYMVKASSSIGFEDLVQQGMIGLYMGLDRYKPSKGKFTTYAGWWVKQEIRRYFDNNNEMIRLPKEKQLMITQHRQSKYLLYKKRNRRPTREEVCEFMNISSGELKYIETLENNVISLNGIFLSPGGEDNELQEMIKNKESIDPEENMLKNNFREELEGVFRILKPRDKYIIKERYGLSDGKEKTLEFIGNKLNLSKERIRQIENDVLKKLERSVLLKRIL